MSRRRIAWPPSARELGTLRKIDLDLPNTIHSSETTNPNPEPHYTLLLAD